ncbi:MAG: thiamine phosphate synthase, partial [Rhodospirillaceae bacterium]
PGLGAVDAILVSPVFATRTRVSRRPLGPVGVARFVADAPVPVFAHGGLGQRRLIRHRVTGAAGFAGIGEFAAE